MKTMLITGTCKSGQTDGFILYDIWIWGQTYKTPDITLVRPVTKLFKDYTEMINFCKVFFCEYFNTDDNNLTILDHITIIWKK